jgi:hypothetical protein
MRRFACLAVAVLAGGFLTVIGAPPASAACHAFTVKAAPETANEGQTVTVTVTRDAAVNPSSVDVSSIDGTAKGGQDFPVVKRTIEFTAETSQTFTIVITDDADTEPDESFKLHLSNGAGCAINPDFHYGTDATVGIAANDAPNTTVPASPTSRPPASPTTTSRATPTTTAPGITAPEQTTSSSASTPAASTTTLRTEDVAAASDDDDDSSSAGGVIAALVVLAAAAAVGVYLFLRRRARP